MSYKSEQKMMKSNKAALATHISYNTARKWKQMYNKYPEKTYLRRKPTVRLTNQTVDST